MERVEPPPLPLKVPLADEAAALTVPTPCRCAPAVVDTTGTGRRAPRARPPRLAVRGLGLLQGLVRDLDLPLQPVQHRVAVDRPPGAAVDRVLGSAGFQPASSLNAPARAARRPL